MSRNYQPGVATKVTSARELLECLGGVDPGLDDGTPAQAPVHRTFDGSEAEVQFLIDNYKREFPDTHRSGAGLRIIATAPRFPDITRDYWDELFTDLEPPTEDDVPWKFPTRSR